MIKAHTTLVVGIGNDFRRDDGVGRAVAAKIRAWNNPQVETRLFNRGSIELINDWKEYAKVYVIDAVVSGEDPGKVFRFTVPPQQLPATHFCTSTHAFNLADVVRLAGTLNALPDTLIIYGVEAKSVDHGEGLTPEVQTGADMVVRNISAELNIPYSP